MIDPALRAAIIAGLNDLQAESNIPATISLWAIAGALQTTNAVCRTVSIENVMAQLEHIIQAHPIAVAGAPSSTTDWGYTQAELEGAT